uniref:Tail protein n=1 Tax=Staphylococcus phage HS12 TaxID=3056402 RepID=A0AA49X2L8_9VIRU|nr:MAG: tail protein [Staphylococcus phage HS12]
MAFIKSPYENIYDETLYNGNGYYNSNGTFITDKTFKYMDKQRTDFLGRGYVVMRNYTLPYFYATYWDRFGNFLYTEKCTLTNGVYRFPVLSTEANDVSFSFHESQEDIEIFKYGKYYYLEAVIQHSQEINGDEKLELDIEYTQNNGEFLSLQKDLNMWIIEFENKEYVIINNEKQGYGVKHRVSCTAILYALYKLNSDRIYERIDESLTTTEGFNYVFKGTPFSYVVVDSAPSSRFQGLGEGESRLEVLKKFIDRWGYELKIVGNVFYFYSQIGNDSNFEYRYKINAQNISQSSDASEMYTYCRGYGDYAGDGGDGVGDESDDIDSTEMTSTNEIETEENSGDDRPVAEKAKLKREYTSPLAKFLGKIHAPPVMDGRIKLVETMDQRLIQRVEGSIVLSFTADIVDMSENGYDYQHSELGDRVFLVDERININREIRVIAMSRTIDALGRLVAMENTFGTASLTDKYEAKFNTAINDITEVMKGNKAIPFNALDTVAQSMVSKIQNTSTELSFGNNGILAIDKNNKNNIVAMNSSGWMLSTDGGKTAKTALTAEGIVADTITTGSLMTSLVNIIGRDSLMYMDGDQFIAKSQIDKRKTVISPSGITITRPDGATWVENGIFKSSMEIQMAAPQPLSAGVEIYGSYYKTSNFEKSYIEEYFFQHKARYLRILGRGKMVHSTDNKYNGIVFVESVENGEAKVVGSQKVLKSEEFEDGNAGELVDITIDLGTPTYGYKHFYIAFRSTSAKSEIYFRRSLVELKD